MAIGLCGTVNGASRLECSILVLLWFGAPQGRSSSKANHLCNPLMSLVSIDSHSFGLEFCSPPLHLLALFFSLVCSVFEGSSSKTAHYVAIIVTPFALPCFTMRVGKPTSLISSCLRSQWSMSDSFDHQCRCCTARILQPIHSVSFADCESFR